MFLAQSSSTKRTAELSVVVMDGSMAGLGVVFCCIPGTIYLCLVICLTARFVIDS